MSRLAYMLLLVASPVFAGVPDAVAPPEPAAEADQVRCTGATYVIERALVEKLLTNTASLAIAARFVPSVSTGKPSGFKVYAVRPNMVYGLIGLENGDLIKSVNSLDVSTPEKALAAYDKLRHAPRFTVEIERRGQLFTLVVNVSDSALPHAQPAVTTAAASPGFARDMDRGIVCSGDHCSIDRALFDKLFADSTELSRSARLVPSMKNGQTNGFKLYAIRPDSFFSRIGLQNGDTIQTINNFELSSPDKALEAYTKIRTASKLTVGIERRGQTITREYSIR